MRRHASAAALAATALILLLGGCAPVVAEPVPVAEASPLEAFAPEAAPSDPWDAVCPGAMAAYNGLWNAASGVDDPARITSEDWQARIDAVEGELRAMLAAAPENLRPLIQPALDALPTTPGDGSTTEAAIWKLGNLRSACGERGFDTAIRADFGG